MKTKISLLALLCIFSIAHVSHASELKGSLDLNAETGVSTSQGDLNAVVETNTTVVTPTTHGIRDINRVGVQDVIRHENKTEAEHALKIKSFLNAHATSESRSFLGNLIKKDSDSDEKSPEAVREHVNKSLDIVVHNFGNIISRLASRIEKMKAVGVDTSAIDASVSVANAALATAKEKIASVDALLSDSNTTKSTLETTVSEAKTALTATRSALENVIQSIKDAMPATPTADAKGSASLHATAL